MVSSKADQVASQKLKWTGSGNEMLSCGSGQVTWFAVNMEWRLIRMLLGLKGVLDRLFENEDNQHPSCYSYPFIKLTF